MAEDKRHEQDAAHEEAFVEVERLSTHSFVSYEGKITPTSSSNVVPEPKSSFESSRCASAISPQSSVLDIQLIVEAEPDDKIGVESVVVKNAKKEMEEIYEQRKKDAWEERKREIGITNTDELISDMAARLRQDLSQGRARCCLGFLDTSTLRIEELAKTLSDAEELMATLNKGQKQQQHKSDAPAVGAAGGHGGGGGGGGSGWWLTYLVAAARAVLGLRRTLRDFDLQGTAELLADAVAKVLHPDAAEEVREVAVFLEQKRELYAAAARLVQYALAGQDDAYDLWEQAARQAGLARSGDLYLPLCLQFARACRRGRAALAARCARAARRADRPSLARLLAQARVMRADPATVAAAAADLARLRALEEGLLGRLPSSPGGGGGGSGGGGLAALAGDPPALRRCEELAAALGVADARKLARFGALPRPALAKVRLRLALHRGDLAAAAALVRELKGLALGPPGPTATAAAAEGGGEEEEVGEGTGPPPAWAAARARFRRLENFEGLRTAAAWSYRLGTRDPALAAARLRWQPPHAPFPTSLTRLPPLHAAAAQRIFECNLMGWGGLVEYTHPRALLEEVLRLGEAVPALRDEIYCQLMKQLSGRPPPAAAARYRAALARCLRRFPPSAALENFLDAFLRERCRRRGGGGGGGRPPGPGGGGGGGGGLPPEPAAAAAADDGAAAGKGEGEEEYDFDALLDLLYQGLVRLEISQRQNCRQQRQESVS